MAVAACSGSGGTGGANPPSTAAPGTNASTRPVGVPDGSKLTSVGYGIVGVDIGGPDAATWSIP
jgi:hypothetical protein